MNSWPELVPAPQLETMPECDQELLGMYACGKILYKLHMF